jgi:hypothetical protein
MRALRNLMILVMSLLLPCGLVDAKGSAPRASRPYYAGGHHTVSHGGTYSGGNSKSHKGGHYKNPKTSNRYGRHK